VIDSIKEMMNKGYSVFIFSTRNPQQIADWFDENFTDSKICLDCIYEWSTLPFSIEKINFWTNGFSKFWNKK
jgi:hypothetical protein